MTRLVTDRDLQGALAMWVCRQHPYRSVEGVDAVNAVIGERIKNEAWDGDDCLRMRRFNDWREIESLLRDAIFNHPQMTAWNTPRSGHSRPHVFVSRFDGPRPEDDFIDISALLRNVAMEAWRIGSVEDVVI